MKASRQQKIISFILLIILLLSLIASLLRAFTPSANTAIMPSAHLMIQLFSGLPI